MDDSNSGIMSFDEMFGLSQRNKQTFGIPGYIIPARYIDGAKIAEEREFMSAPRPNKVNKKAKTNDRYLDKEFKRKAFIPGPGKYIGHDKWVEEKRKAAKVDWKSQPRKKTYLDEIIDRAKVDPRPGPSDYKKREDLPNIKEIGRPIKFNKENLQLQKYNLYENVMRDKIEIPGPGEYNPRKIKKVEKSESRKPKDFIQKHKEDEKAMKVRNKTKGPSPCEYNPTPIRIRTFGNACDLPPINSIENNVSKSMIFTSEPRFNNKKVSKSQLIVPGPGNYDILARWEGKPLSIDKDKVKKNVLNFISKGITKSIYYS